MSAERRNDKNPQPATARVFFALWPPADLAEGLGHIARDAAATFGGRASREQTIHLTLAFLGNVPESRLPELSSVAASVRAEAFALNIDHLGYWPHNHLLWAGCGAPPSQLAELFGRLRDALNAAGFKAGRAGGEFSPHISLLRRVPEGAIAPTACPKPIDPLRWSCSHFVLVRSYLTAAGADYRVVAEFPLSAARASMA